MEEVIKTGFDQDLEQAEEIKKDEAVFKPRPFFTWTVKGNEYKLKLTTQVITKLESQFKASLLEAVLEKGIPELYIIVAVLQGALLKFHHGIKSENVMEMLDDYFGEGHTQFDLLQEVIYPIMYDAGFFTKAQMETLQEGLRNVDSDL